MCAATSDLLEVKLYQRLSPLEVAKQSLKGTDSLGQKKSLRRALRNLRPGDAVIAFSRKKIFELKQVIEENSEYKCCVMYASTVFAHVLSYGNLPPESRTE